VLEKGKVMLAYRLLQAQTQPEFQEVPEPHAGPGQVVIKVAGSGLCHTDFIVIAREPGYWKSEPPPFTLGHEIAGAIRLALGWERRHPCLLVRDRQDESQLVLA
jgi:propanol-preferring alcohol dehydrogenase